MSDVKKALFAIAVNLALWIFLVLGLIGLSLAGTKLFGFPAVSVPDEVSRFIDLKLYFSLLFACGILFAVAFLVMVFSPDAEKARRYTNPALKEASSVLINFGSLLIAAAICANELSIWAVLAGLANYVCGLVIALVAERPPKPAPASQVVHYDGTDIQGEWTLELGSSDYEEKAVITRDRALIKGTIEVIKSPTGKDVGKRYTFQGFFKDGFLTGQYKINDRQRFDSGTIMLKLINGGTEMHGHAIGYHDPSHEIKSWTYVWKRKS